MSVDLLPWDDTGLDLLRACNPHEQTKYLGGPETEAKLLDRHARYLTYHRLGDTEMMRIAVNGVAVGSVGYWEIERSGEKAYERAGPSGRLIRDRAWAPVAPEQ